MLDAAKMKTATLRPVANMPHFGSMPAAGKAAGAGDFKAMLDAAQGAASAQGQG